MFLDLFRSWINQILVSLHPCPYDHSLSCTSGLKLCHTQNSSQFYINRTSNRVYAYWFQESHYFYTKTTSKQAKNREHCRAAWRIFIPTRWFKPTETKTMHKLMNRLAAHACPPGGFWAETQKTRKQHNLERGSCNRVYPIKQYIV